jgi:uncharacterized protein YggU (UPF0235/DUF167 family)
MMRSWISRRLTEIGLGVEVAVMSGISLMTRETPSKSSRVPLTLAVWVTPRANADEVVGWRSDARDELAIRVSAAPEGGKANAAVTRTLAHSLGIPKSTVEVLRGHMSRQKFVAFKMDEREYGRWRDSLPVRQ